MTDVPIARRAQAAVLLVILAASCRPVSHSDAGAADALGLLVDAGGDSNVDKRALKAALARPHDEPWFAALRDRQRFSPQMRRWVETCMAERSNDEIACIRAARTEPQLTACGR